MKTKLTFGKLFSTLIIVVFFLTAHTELFAQEKAAKLEEFKLIIEQTDNGIKMKSDEGSAWIDLSFSLQKNQSQAVDEYGMTELDQVSKNRDENLTNFLFTIAKTKNGIELKGFEGTAWKELKFSFADNKKQAINQFGMTSLD